MAGGVRFLCAVQKSSTATVTVAEDAFAFEDVSETHSSEAAAPIPTVESVPAPALIATPPSTSGNFVFEDTSDIRRTPYEIDVQGSVPASVLKEFQALGLLPQNREKRLVSAEQAWQFAKQDATTLEDLCAKAGYFDAKVSVDVLTLSGGEASHFRITFRVVLGERYRITQKRLTGPLAEHPRLKKLQRKYFSVVNEPVDFAQIIAERHRLKAELQNVGAYLVHVHEPDVVIDRTTREATVAFVYDHAQRTRVGKIIVTGEGTVPEVFIRNRLVFREGRILTKKPWSTRRKIFSIRGC